MSKTNNLTDFLTDIANAIRYSTDVTSMINPQNFSDEIKKLKPQSIAINLNSDTTLVDDDLSIMKMKQIRLSQAVDNTIIDGEIVYKMTQQKNAYDSSYLDTIMYTKEGDSGNYYYVLSGIDNYLNKVTN